MLTISALSRFSNEGLASLNAGDVLKTAFPELEIKTAAPGCWGHGGDVSVRNTSITLPDGTYSSRKHYHRASSAVVGFETGRKKLNIAPVVLVETRAWNGDYGSMKVSYFLISRNEDSSFFAHKIRPSAGASLDTARAWMWQLRDNETVSARQGDLALIPITRPAGSVSETDSLGNHFVTADEVRATKHKFYALNPALSHEEHNPVALKGWFELRLARAWQSSVD